MGGMTEEEAKKAIEKMRARAKFKLVTALKNKPRTVKGENAAKDKRKKGSKSGVSSFWD